MHSQWRLSIAPSLFFATPFSIFIVAKTFPRGFRYTIFLSFSLSFSQEKRKIYASIGERKKVIERKKVRERKDVDLYLSILGDRSVRGLDLRLDCCRQKCGLVYRWWCTRWRRSGDGIQDKPRDIYGTTPANERRLVERKHRAKEDEGKTGREQNVRAAASTDLSSVDASLPTLKITRFRFKTLMYTRTMMSYGGYCT